jgi:hypothetical protein
MGIGEFAFCVVALSVLTAAGWRQGAPHGFPFRPDNAVLLLVGWGSVLAHFLFL